MPQYYKNTWVITDSERKVKRAVKTEKVLRSYLVGMYGFGDLDKFIERSKFTLPLREDVLVEKIELVDGRLYRHHVIPLGKKVARV